MPITLDEESVTKACQRLTQAVERVSLKLNMLSQQAYEANNQTDLSNASNADRARLAQRLDDSQGRERELLNAAQDARHCLANALESLQEIIKSEEGSS